MAFQDHTWRAPPLGLDLACPSHRVRLGKMAMYTMLYSMFVLQPKTARALLHVYHVLRLL